MKSKFLKLILPLATTIGVFAFAAEDDKKIVEDLQARYYLKQINKDFDGALSDAVMFVPLGLDYVKEALADGANIDNHVDCDGMTPLMRAAETTKPDIVNYLLDNKANINERDDLGDTALYWSIRNPDSFEICKELIKRGIEINVHYDQEDQTIPLFFAIARGLNYVKLLLESGANFDEVDAEGNSVIEYAKKVDMPSSWISEDERKQIIEELENYKKLRDEGIQEIPTIMLENHKLSLPLGKLIAGYCYDFAE